MQNHRQKFIIEKVMGHLGARKCFKTYFDDRQARTICVQDLSAHCDPHMQVFFESPYVKFTKMTRFGHFGSCARIVWDLFSFSSQINRKQISHSAH